jgi:hypothetical protein
MDGTNIICPNIERYWRLSRTALDETVRRAIHNMLDECEATLSFAIALPIS